MESVGAARPHDARRHEEEGMVDAEGDGDAGQVRRELDQLRTQLGVLWAEAESPALTVAASHHLAFGG